MDKFREISNTIASRWAKTTYESYLSQGSDPSEPILSWPQPTTLRMTLTLKGCNGERFCEGCDGDRHPLKLEYSIHDFSKLSPDKGLLMFLNAIAKNPGERSWATYCKLCGQKPTSFGSTRNDLIYGYEMVTADYHVTGLGQELLKAYDLA